MEHLSNDPKDGPNQHDNGHKLCDEAGHVLSLTENQWKLRQKMVRISQWRENHCRTNTSDRRNKSVQKSRTESHSQGRKVNHLSKVIWNRKIIT